MNYKYRSIKEITAILPHRSHTRVGAPMEPVSLIVIGNKRSILHQFGMAGWYLADSINFSSSLKSAVATIFNSSYKTGPMWPAFIDNYKHMLGFERPTRADTYRRRHHLRLWKTKIRLNHQIVWVGTISYDKSVGLVKNSIIPTHHISSNLKSEENFLARTFRIPKPIYITLRSAEIGTIYTGDKYIWDGKALVLDLSTYAS